MLLLYILLLYYYYILYYIITIIYTLYISQLAPLCFCDKRGRVPPLLFVALLFEKFILFHSFFFHFL